MLDASGRVDARRNAERDVMGIGPVHVGARCLNQFAHTNMFRLGKVSKSEPRQCSRCSEQRNAIAFHFEELAASISDPDPAALVVYRESCPKGILGLLASKCVERWSVPAIVLAPSASPGFAVGSGRTVEGLLVRILAVHGSEIVAIWRMTQAIFLSKLKDRAAPSRAAQTPTAL